MFLFLTIFYFVEFYFDANWNKIRWPKKSLFKFRVERILRWVLYNKFQNVVWLNNHVSPLLFYTCDVILWKQYWIFLMGVVALARLYHNFLCCSEVIFQIFLLTALGYIKKNLSCFTCITKHHCATWSSLFIYRFYTPLLPIKKSCGRDCRRYSLL